MYFITNRTIVGICRKNGYAVLTGDSDFVLMGVDVIFPFDDECELSEGQALSICPDNPSFNLEQLLDCIRDECHISPSHFFFACLIQGNDYVNGQRIAKKSFKETLEVLQEHRELFDSITDVKYPDQMIGKNELIDVYARYQIKKPSARYGQFFKLYAFRGNRLSSIDYRFLGEKLVKDLWNVYKIQYKTLIDIFTAIEKTNCQERLNRSLFSIIRIASEDIEIDGHVFSLSRYYCV